MDVVAPSVIHPTAGVRHRPWHQLARAAGAALLVVGAVTACGGGGSSGAAGGDQSSGGADSAAVETDDGKAIELDESGGNAGPQLCAKFSPKQVEKWLGVKVGKGEVSGPLNSACTWETKDSQQSLMIQMVPADMFQSKPYPDEYVTLEGVGDEAWVGPGGFGDWDTHVRVGDRATVVASVMIPGDAKGVSTTVMKAILPRIFP